MDIGTIILVACFAVPAAIGILVALITQADILQSTAREMQANMHTNTHTFWGNDCYSSQINPASGLPMTGGVDVAGNAWGCNGSDD